jgi:metal-dependent hydrolase
MKKVLVLVMLFSILCAERISAEELRIMSFNVRYNTPKDLGENSWDARKGAVVNLIKQMSPDVVGLQEPRTIQRAYIKESLPEYAYMEAPGTGDGRGGNVGLIYRSDKFEKVDGGWFYLGPTPDIPSPAFDAPDSTWRVTIWAKLRDKKSGKEFTALSTHLPVRTKPHLAAEPYVKSRFHASQLNVKRLKDVAGEDGTCFIVGDMNCSLQQADGSINYDGVKALSPYHEWMEDARKFDEHPEINSFNAFGRGEDSPHRKIDQIYYRNAQPISFVTITEPVDGFKYVSDHYPLMFTCEY